MALPSKPPMAASQIKTELGTTSNSLEQFGILGGFAIPYRMSQFLGYAGWANDYALDYDGVNDYVRGGIISGIPNRTFTVSMWVRIDATTKHNMAFYAWCGTEGNIGDDRFLIYYAASVNRLIVQFRRGSDAALYVQAYPLHDAGNATASGVTNSGTGWVSSQRGNTDAQGFTHLCFAIDQTLASSTSGIETYWNGVNLPYSVNNTSTCNTGLNCNFMSIGDNPTTLPAPAIPIEGVIDEVYIYSNQLSSTDVNTIYGFGRKTENTFTTGYVTDIRMENTVADQQGLTALSNNGATFIPTP